jgi:ubiquinone/menaquinone biosynthesis C-methylase UbiE
MSVTHIDPLAERKRQVPGDFDTVAGTYDLLTGMNPGYRKHLRWSAERLQLWPGARILDLCCGTGLSTAAVARTYPGSKIDALDASSGMLDRAAKKRYPAEVNFVHGDAMDPAACGLPGPYDGILMAYGIRNMPDRDLALQRLMALLKPGGRVVFHEYSVADSRRARMAWEIVTRSIIIPSGLVANGTAEIYKYLRESVNRFDGVSAFEDRLHRAGFVNVETKPMDGWQKGVVHSFIAQRPESAR